MESLSAEDKLIVLCGGGIIKSDDNIANMRDSGCVILLEATPETIYNRVRDNDSRPLLRQKPGN